MSKEPSKREDLPKSEQGQPKDTPNPYATDKPPADKLGELRAKGEATTNLEEGPYHGYTPKQAELVEEARGDPEPGTDGIVESPNEPPGSDVLAGIPVDESTPQSKEYKQPDTGKPPKNEEEAAATRRKEKEGDDDKKHK